jgi:hypothetical protein
MTYHKIAFSTIQLIAVIAFGVCSCKEDPKAKMPDFNFRLSDSATVINTGKIEKGSPIALVRFSVDCHDCQIETEKILANMDSLKSVRFYFLTTDGFDRIRVFNKHYKIADYKNVTVGQDYQSFLPVHFGTYATPYLALYKGDKKLAGLFEGRPEIHDLINQVNKIQ